MALSDILEGVGNVLSAPRNLLYKGLISPLMGRDVNGFSDILTGTFGMDPDNFATKALGFMGDIGTDPLTYAGGFGASALRNKMFGEAANLGKAGATAATGLSAAPEIRAAAEATPVIWGAKLGEMGAGAKPGLSALEGRSGFSLASHPGETGAVLTGEVSPGAAATGSNALANKASSLRELFEASPELTSGGLQGAYDPSTKTIFSSLERPALEAGGAFPESGAAALGTRRHELMHALIRQGQDNPALQQQLSFLPRMASKLSASESPFARGVGEVLNETAAHAAQSRSLMGQLQNAGHFLFNPERVAAYQPQIARQSPLAAALYGVLPSTFPVAGGAAGYGLSSQGY